MCTFTLYAGELTTEEQTLSEIPKGITPTHCSTESANINRKSSVSFLGVSGF